MKNNLILAVLCVIALFTGIPTVSAQEPDKEYQEVLNKLMVISGSLASVDKMVPQIMDVMKRQYPSVSDDTWNAVTEKARQFFKDRLLKTYTPIYQKYMTLDDLKKITAFYESPLGKKYGEATVAILQDGVGVGQQLGMELLELIRKELEAHGNK